MTSESKKLLYNMYSEYKLRRKNNMSRKDSVFFGSYEDVAQLSFDYSPADVDDFLRELNQLGFVRAKYADNHVYLCALTYEAIEHMEQLPADYFRSVVDFVTKFIP